MISGIDSTSSMFGASKITDQMEQIRLRQAQNIQDLNGVQSTDRVTTIQPGIGVEEPGKVTFGKLIGELVGEVDAKGKDAAGELRKVMTGEVDNLHQSMVAMQEASVAFNLMVEVRNKMMESYQQIMRMQV